jgi:hypothetical protein
LGAPVRDAKHDTRASNCSPLKPSLASLEAGGYLLPTGELPFTLLLHEPNRDVPKPLRHHGAKPINGRPTSIQPWQYSKESPPLRHWI